MKISIITVVFNNNATIRTAIESVLSQSYKDIEYIIIDGKSSDGTMDVVNEFKLSIDKIVSEKDNGIYDAMNKGIKLATGDVIGILNSDDVYANEHVISDIMSVFKAEPTVDLVYGNLVYVKADDITSVKRLWVNLPYFEKYFEKGNVPPHPSLFVKKKVYEIAGLFNVDFKLAADYEFMLRIFKRYTFKSIYVDILCVKMRLGGSTNKSIKNIVQGNLEILKSWQINGMHAPFTLMPRRVAKRLVQFLK
jgi:glycosyltransferase involved in cell wall biosynthesis